MGFSLLAVAVVLLVGSLVLLRPNRSASGLRVLARLPLEPRRSLLVVELAGRTLVLSSSEAGLTLLTELDAAQAAQLAPAQTVTPGQGIFVWAASRLGR